MIRKNFEFDLRSRVVFLIFIGYFFSIIVALRPIGSDRDSLAYLSLFDAIANGSVNDLRVISDADIGFLLIAKVSNFFTIGFRGLLLMYSLLAFTLKLCVISKQSIYPYVSLYIYITAFMLLHEVTQIRAAVSIGFFLLSLPDLFKKRYFIYTLKIFPAILFHYSALILLLLPLIERLKIKYIFYSLFPIILFFLTKAKVSLLILFRMLLPVLPSFLSNKINIYLALLANSNSEGLNLYSFAHISMLFLYYFLLYVNKYLASDYDRFLVRILFYGICSFYIFSFLPVFAVRISGYLSTVLIVLLPNSVYAIKEKKMMVLGIFFIFSLGFVYYFFTLINIPIFSI